MLAPDLLNISSTVLECFKLLISKRIMGLAFTAVSVFAQTRQELC